MLFEFRMVEGCQVPFIDFNPLFLTSKVAVANVFDDGKRFVATLYDGDAK
jgi:hypothetical protein